MSISVSLVVLQLQHAICKHSQIQGYVALGLLASILGRVTKFRNALHIHIWIGCSKLLLHLDELWLDAVERLFQDTVREQHSSKMIMLCRPASCRCQQHSLQLAGSA